MRINLDAFVCDLCDVNCKNPPRLWTSERRKETQRDAALERSHSSLYLFIYLRKDVSKLRSDSRILIEPQTLDNM